MLIRVIEASHSLALDEPKDFGHFAIRIEGAFDPVDLRELLKGFTTSADSEHAWVSQKALREWPGLADEVWWQEGLSAMIAAAQRFGWVDATADAIRAHIEYAR
jgi:hypothetical protein